MVRLWPLSVVCVALVGCAPLEDRFGCGFDSDCLPGRVCHPTLECVATDPAQWTARISYTLEGSEEVYVTSVAAPSESPTSLSDSIEAAFDDDDGHGVYGISADARWLAVSSWCDEAACLPVIDLEKGDGADLIPRMRDGVGCPTDSDACHPGAYVAIASSGRVVVWAENDETGVWAVHRTDVGSSLDESTWGPPIDLSSALEIPDLAEDIVGDYSHFDTLSIAPDGRAAVFACGDASPGWIEYGAICRASTDGRATVVLVHPTRDATHPDLGGTDLDTPSFARDGSLVFEADWGSSSGIWRRSTDGRLERLTSVDEDWGAPCPLPDGRVLGMQMDWTDTTTVGKVRPLGEPDAPVIWLEPLNSVQPFLCHL